MCPSSNIYAIILIYDSDRKKREEVLCLIIIIVSNLDEAIEFIAEWDIFNIMHQIISFNFK